MSGHRVVPLILAFALVAFAAPLGAGSRATLVLVSGERVRGEFVGMSGADCAVRDGGGERRVPLSSVAVIDFVGGGQAIPGAEVSRMEVGRHLVVQRGGDYFHGQLAEVRGETPLRLVFTTPDGRIELNADEVGRIYLQRWEGMPGR
jgi:hypothetical protein